MCVPTHTLTLRVRLSLSRVRVVCVDTHSCVHTHSCVLTLTSHPTGESLTHKSERGECEWAPCGRPTALRRLFTKGKCKPRFTAAFKAEVPPGLGGPSAAEPNLWLGHRRPSPAPPAGGG